MRDSTPARARAQVVWTKIVLYGCPGTECGNFIDPPPARVPPESELYGCAEFGRWLFERVFLCDRHAREVAELVGDDLDEIDAAWKEHVRG